MGSSGGGYSAADEEAKLEARRKEVERKAQAEASARGNADAEGGDSAYEGGALAKKKARKQGATLSGEGSSTFMEKTSSLGG